MSAERPKLVLKPQRCDGCGRCLDECRHNAIRVGPGFIYVDWNRCDGCGKCAAWCDREAIFEKGSFGAAEEAAPAGGLAYGAGAELPKVAVTQGTSNAAGAFQRIHARLWGPQTGLPGVGAVDGAPAEGEAPVAWAPGEAVFVVVTVVVLTVGMQWALASDLVQSLRSSGILLARGVVIGLYYALQVALLLVLALRRDVGLASAFRLDAPPDLISVFLGLSMLVGTWLFSVLFRVTALAIGWTPPTAESPSLTQLFGTDAAGMTLTAVVLVLVGPAIEELLLRGVVLGALQERLGRWWGIGLSAVLFAALHGSLWRFLPLVVLGLALGRLATGRRSLWPAIALHVSYNGVLVAFGLLATRGG
ncbi:MAG TPA: CPBP family glutamic-type intramembrane protease [Coriobacteriia bacterium]